MEFPKNNPLKKLEELARQAKERGFVVEKRDSNKEVITQEQALEIMGANNFYGTEEIWNTFGINPDDVPEIPFTKKELEYANQLGQELVLYLNKLNNGNPLTIIEMSECLSWTNAGCSINLAGLNQYKYEELKKEAPRSGWRLCDTKYMSGTYNENFLDQAEEMTKGIMRRYKDQNLPVAYQVAIEEFKEKKSELLNIFNSLSSQERQRATKAFTELKINQLCRETAPELMYRLALHRNKTGKSMFELNILTNSQLKLDSLAVVYQDDKGRIITRDHTLDTGYNWAVFSRGV